MRLRRPFFVRRPKPALRADGHAGASYYVASTVGVPDGREASKLFRCENGALLRHGLYDAVQRTALKGVRYGAARVSARARGRLAADSWNLTIEEIQRLAPELTVLALDMPGRRNKPGDLREMTIADYVDSLVGDIESAGWRTSSSLVIHLEVCRSQEWSPNSERPGCAKRSSPPLCFRPKARPSWRAHRG